MVFMVVPHLTIKFFGDMKGFFAYLGLLTITMDL